MIVKLLRCKTCGQYPFVEKYKTIENPFEILKIFCIHNIVEGKNFETVAKSWNALNEKNKEET